MTSNRFVRATSALAFAAVIGGCDDGLTELNRDPNNPTDARPEYLLAQGTTSAVGRALGANFHLTLTALFAQQIAKIQYPDEDLYELRDATINGHWAGFYAGPLSDFHELINKAEALDKPNYLGAGLTMKSWTFGQVTDLWGDIPYSEALRGLEPDGTPQPKYDEQKDVYLGILSDLTRASQAFTPGAELRGDPIYGGDAAAWARFANSLRLRYAMRMADVDPAKARAEFTSALSAGVFTSNAHTADLEYGGIPDNNPIHENQRTRDDHGVSLTLVDTLKALSDPRLAVFAEKNSQGVYRGMPNGTEVRPGPINEFSRIGSYFVQPNTPAVLQSYAEVLFLQAEAAQRGWISGSAAQLYRAAIRASLEQYGISEEAIVAYLAQPSVQYDPARGLQQIALQKWIALFNNGPEAYAEWRRLDAPNLVAGPDVANGGVIPVRVYYPSDEQRLNAANLEAAVKRSGGDDFNDRVWWDVR